MQHSFLLIKTKSDLIMSRFDDIFEEDIKTSKRTAALSSGDMEGSATIIKLEDRRSKILPATACQRQISTAKRTPSGE